jgi:hypothetical protein
MARLLLHELLLFSCMAAFAIGAVIAGPARAFPVPRIMVWRNRLGAVLLPVGRPGGNDRRVMRAGGRSAWPPWWRPCRA